MKRVNTQEVNPRPAIIAGVSLIVMTLAAFFSYGFAHTSLVMNDDAMATLNKLQSSLLLFHFELVGWGIIILTDIIVSWAFYMVLKPVHRSFALVAGGIRLLYTSILAVAVFQLGRVTTLIQNDSTVTRDLAAQVMGQIESFETTWSIGLIVFGIHLLAVGTVAMKAAFIPKVISLLLLIAGGSYMLIHSMYNLTPQYEEITGMIEMFLSLPMIIGELGFGMWLLINGIKPKVNRSSLQTP
ncbi:DUF4386 domain-containing protein [Alkalihalobacillus sp. CinArs1]|uniref:DUF4386 domain-containing protein n=1 Tax=Alkalihalobacillus sp. CinArs1 TaxID=2995314 RepID=UPI0022DE25FD|nr:DUF4386 domain-containing protein [Alkalihalobacillus sp. CinArs1]